MKSIGIKDLMGSKLTILSLVILAMAQSCSPATDRPEPTQIETIQIPTLTLTLEPTAAPSTALPSAPSDISPTLLPTADEYYILSLADNGYQHLFIYSPSAIPLYRITNGTWDDISPAISPDGKRVTFSSRRNGYFDIYILDLETGDVSRVTDSLAYDPLLHGHRMDNGSSMRHTKMGNLTSESVPQVTQPRLQSY